LKRRIIAMGGLLLSTLKNPKHGCIFDDEENKMKIIYVVVACALMFIVTASPVSAKVVVQDWSPFEMVTTDDFDCAGEDGLAQGMRHLTVATMPRGGFSFHLNARGTWTGLQSGNEVKWLDNINDVLPIDGENFVLTQQQRLRLLGQGPGNDFFLKYKFHVTVIGGEVTAYVDSFTTECIVD
jgi:hypothetical protein